MSNWKAMLNADPKDWLLEPDNPSVRYFTLVDILEKAASEPLVREAKAEIMKTGVVPKILDKQASGGYWGIPEDFYIRSKYTGTVWQLIILAELGAAETDSRIKKTCEFILENSQDRKSGGFAYFGAKDGCGGDHAKILPCLTGNMVWSLIRLGFLEDARVQQGINWITRYQRFDDAIEEPPTGWPYDRYPKCWGTHTCHMGVVKTLKALAEIPIAQRSSEVQKTIESGAEYMLKHRIYKRSHDLSSVSKSQWLSFGFPLLWNTDALEILGLLTNLGYRDKRMQEAFDLVKAKQDAQGQWLLETTFNGRFRVNIERKGKPSKWITLNAVKALKRFYD